MNCATISVRLNLSQSIGRAGVGETILIRGNIIAGKIRMEIIIIEENKL